MCGLRADGSGGLAAVWFGAVNRDLARLLNSVEAADQRPTMPQVDAVNETCTALSHALTLWKQFGRIMGVELR